MYELTFISAPRSMQGTAMGMFYLLTGFANLTHLLIENVMIEHNISVNTETAKIWYWATGFGGNLISLTSLVLVHKKYDLGLSLV